MSNVKMKVMKSVKKSSAKKVLKKTSSKKSVKRTVSKSKKIVRKTPSIIVNKTSSLGPSEVIAKRVVNRISSPMESFNKKISSIVENAPKTINEEGAIVYEKKEDVALFEMMNSFIFKGGFYWDAKEKLSLFEKLIDINLDKDKEFVLASALFSNNTLGIRLAPVLVLTRYALTDNNISDEDKRIIAKLALAFFNRPDKISNALGYAKNFLGYDSIKKVRKFYKKALRKSLEKMSGLTLKKFKMKGKEIKLADLIKVLRPVPKNDEMSKLYKSIIENTDKSALKEEEHITATLSSNKITEEKKQEIIEESVDKIPINALIRNISQFNDSDDDTLNAIDRRLGEVLKDGSTRIVNPFDLVFTADDIRTGNQSKVNKKLMDIVDKNITGKFLKNFDLRDKNITFLVDVSFSMKNSGIVRAGKFISMMTPMMDNPKVILFDTSIKTYQSEDVTNVVNKCKDYPNFNCSQFLSTISSQRGIWGGTSLLESADIVTKNDKSIDILVVLTDEVSWSDNDEKSLDEYNKQLTKNIPNLKVILVNVNPTDKTTFAIKRNFMRMSGLDAKIFNYMDLLGNFEAFKSRIKKEYREFIKA